MASRYDTLDASRQLEQAIAEDLQAALGSRGCVVVHNGSATAPAMFGASMPTILEMSQGIAAPAKAQRWPWPCGTPNASSRKPAMLSKPRKRCAKKRATGLLVVRWRSSATLNPDFSNNDTDIRMSDDTKVHQGSPELEGKELYDAAWRLWRENRNIKQTAAELKVSPATVHRLVTEGSKRLLLPSFRSRITEFERQKTKEIARTVAKVEIDTWDKVKKQNLDLSDGAKAALAPLLVKAIEAAKTARFTRTRIVQGEDGKFVPVEVPLSILDVAQAVRSIVSAISQLGQHDSLWLGGPTERKELLAAAVPAGWLELTPEQIDVIIASGGKELPEGVDETRLWGLAPTTDGRPS
jgi:hypothetical protein